MTRPTGRVGTGVPRGVEGFVTLDDREVIRCVGRNEETGKTDVKGKKSL